MIIGHPFPLAWFAVLVPFGIIWNETTIKLRLLCRLCGCLAVLQQPLLCSSRSVIQSQLRNKNNSTLIFFASSLTSLTPQFAILDKAFLLAHTHSFRLLGFVSVNHQSPNRKNFGCLMWYYFTTPPLRLSKKQEWFSAAGCSRQMMKQSVWRLSLLSRCHWGLFRRRNALTWILISTLDLLVKICSHHLKLNQLERKGQNIVFFWLA